MTAQVSETAQAVIGRHRLLVVAGFASIVTGVTLAAWVGYEWFIVGVSHEVIALLAGVGVLFGTQLLVFALMASMLITLYHEQRSYLTNKGDGDG